MNAVHPDSLMARPAVTGLRRAEAAALKRVLATAGPGHDLHLGMPVPTGDAWGHLGRPTRLELRDGHWRGDVRARVDEALPFRDGAFRVVVLDHVLEWTPLAAAVLDEAVRVLADDGTLLVGAFHPFSLWMPWLLCRRRPRPMLTPPGWLRQRLAAHGVDIARITRCGAAWPHRHEGGARPAWAGGAFVLAARKSRATIKPLASVYTLRHRPAGKKHGSWVPGTQRECA